MDHSPSCAANTPGGELRATPLARLAGRAVRCAAALRDLGPYALLVLLVPGGSLIALALGLYRTLRIHRDAATLRPAFVRARTRSYLPVLKGELR